MQRQKWKVSYRTGTVKTMVLVNEAKRSSTMINGATKVPALFNHLVEAILRGQMCNDPPTLTESLQIIGGLTVELYQKAIVTLRNSGLTPY